MANDSELLIKIKMLLEGREAASEATAAIKSASDATMDAGSAQAAAAVGTEKLGKETGKTNLELQGLSKYGAAGSQIISGLNRAASGGVVNSLTGVATAIRGVVSAAGINPLAGFIAAIAGAGGIIYTLSKFRSESDATTDSLHGIGSSASTAAEKLKAAAKAGEELGEVSIQALTSGTAAVADETERYVARLTEALDLSKQLLAAQTSARIGQIKAGDGTDEEKQRQIDELELTLKQAQARTPLERAAITTQAAQRRADAARAEEASLARGSRSVDQEHDDLALALVDARAAVQALKDRILFPSVFQGGEELARLEVEVQTLLDATTESAARGKKLSQELQATHARRLKAERELADAAEAQARLAAQIGREGERTPQTILGNIEIEADAKAAADEAKRKNAARDPAPLARPGSLPAPAVPAPAASRRSRNRGPTPPNPPGSGMTNDEWEEYYRRDPEAAEQLRPRRIDPSSNEGVRLRAAERVPQSHGGPSRRTRYDGPANAGTTQAILGPGVATEIARAIRAEFTVLH